MRNLIKKPTTFIRIEFWALTTLFAFVMFFFVQEIFVGDDKSYTDVPYKHFFDESGTPFSFYENYFIPQLIKHLVQFCYVFILNFVLIPRLIKKEALSKNITFIVLLFTTIVMVFGITGTYLKEYLYAGNHGRDSIDQAIFWSGFEHAVELTWALLLYTGIKYAGLYLLTISEKIEVKYRFIRKEAIVAAVVWLTVLLLMVLGDAEWSLIGGWMVVIPSAIVLYLFSFYRLIPRALRYNNYQFLFYVLKCAAILFVAFIVFVFLLIAITDNGDISASISAFNSMFQLFIIVPLSWTLYKRLLKGNEQINVLQKELKQSSASIDFLRSQINPHFLFNALNTLYGTAIQENAERTSEGIQKLGDMMRFMLQENMQNTISLAREIEYLTNYISLQRLRTDASPEIQIQTAIQDRQTMYRLAPMLLIPFVENAFKHGISFREPSFIKVTLETKENTLYFDVYNSKHVRMDNDPEKDKSGIGLENVKQRLKLLYPNRHELIVRDTSKEFFIHLTIQLT